MVDQRVELKTSENIYAPKTPSHNHELCSVHQWQIEKISPGGFFATRQIDDVRI